MTPQHLVRYAHGKLLITGEYLVLEGARALALPVNRGQFLIAKPILSLEMPRLHWTALKPDGLWFRATYLLPELKITNTTDRQLAGKLTGLLSAVRTLNPNFLNGSQSFDVETRLEFDTEFGWGSSSTLVANLAAWAGVDAIALQWKALGGSGYDVACATAESPVFYQIIDQKPVVEPVSWQPPFHKNIFFVYLGKKQRSDQSIKKFKQKAGFTKETIYEISEIGNNLVKTESLPEFEALLQRHENLMSKVLGITPVKQRLFKNYNGTVKSLGAWGGDFVLVTSQKDKGTFAREMHALGFQTLFSWNELVLNAEK